MDLDVIKSFLKAAETMSFSRAAASLGISQPAVSRHIQRLEDEMKTTLFKRDRSRIALTERGAKLKEELEPLISRVTEVLQGNDQSQEVAGSLRIGCLADAGPFFEMAVDYHKAHPGVRVDFGLMPNPKIVEALKADQVDLGIVSILPRSDSIQAFKLARQFAVMVCSRNNPIKLGQTGNEPVPFVRYRFHDLLHDDNESFLTPYLKKFQKALGIKSIKVPFTVNSFDAMCTVVERTHCFAVMPYHKVRKHISDGVLRLATDKKLEKPLFLIQKRGRPLDPTQGVYKKLILNRGR
jgi:DNA-binding transcriptional LysR family regulator